LPHQISPPALGQTPRPPLPPGPYLVVGLGKAGFAAARELAEAAAPGAVRAWDSAADTIQKEGERELERIGVKVGLGGDGLDLLAGVRTLVKSPGVPPEIPLVEEARRRGMALVDELEIGWLLVPAPTVAVTGTNGKSTTAAILTQVLGAHGLQPALAGNTEFGPSLSELAAGGPPASVVAEVSSYQTEFAAELAVDAAVFTNLTPDHLNRHRGMEAYAAAKRRLFVRGDWCVPLASLNADDALGRDLCREVRERGGRALTYGFDEGADYRIVDSRWGMREAESVVETPAGTVRVESRMPGRHNAANAVAALALADGLGLPREATLSALAAVPPVPGRYEAIAVERPFDVVIDFANSPDSVARNLETARETAAARGGRVLTVLCLLGRAAPFIGPEVGAVARRLSDHLVLSGSSYRGEPRLVAMAALLAGARPLDRGGLEIVVDRRQAIAKALEAAAAGDVLMILGRGPTAVEATDRRGGFVELDDREVVRELLA
jgi:UDP-N-acetylmuramoyl-L-alanyl-D-glutamate--2,6-diaminopimelate ligase